MAPMQMSRVNSLSILFNSYSSNNNNKTKSRKMHSIVVVVVVVGIATKRMFDRLGVPWPKCTPVNHHDLFALMLPRLY